jgi:Zn ribbon nucleic-acid-binding protein
MTDAFPTPTRITVREWRAMDADAATPRCPNCKMSLGIRLGMWRERPIDAWLCDSCGEFERVPR